MISIERDQYRGHIFAALADPTRRQIVEMLGRSPLTATQIHDAFPIAAPAVSRHLRVLREAGLVTDGRVEGDNRIRLYTLEPQALSDISSWLDELSSMWQGQLESFKKYVAVRKTRSEEGR